MSEGTFSLFTAPLYLIQRTAQVLPESSLFAKCSIKIRLLEYASLVAERLALSLCMTALREVPGFNPTVGKIQHMTIRHLIAQILSLSTFYFLNMT